jgi:hypothetical protein
MTARVRGDGRLDRARIDESGLRAESTRQAGPGKSAAFGVAMNVIGRDDSSPAPCRASRAMTDPSQLDADDPLLPGKMAESPFERGDARSKRQKQRPGLLATSSASPTSCL